MGSGIGQRDRAEGGREQGQGVGKGEGEGEGEEGNVNGVENAFASEAEVDTQTIQLR